MDIQISQHTKDIIQKYTSGLFKNATLEFYGIKTARIKEPINVELPVVEVSETSTDYVFLLEDDTCEHFEFQTKYNKEDLIRFAKYDLRLYERDKREITTVIIYSSDVKTAAESLKIGSLVYTPINVMMCNYDGNAIFTDLENKLKTVQELSENDMLNLIFLPLMKNNIPKYQLAEKSVKLAKTIKNESKSNLCVASAIAFSYKYLSYDEINNLMEALKMNNVIENYIIKEVKIRLNDAVNEAVNDAVNNALNEKAIKMAKGAIKKGLSIEDIADLTGLDAEEIKELQEELEKEE